MHPATDGHVGEARGSQRRKKAAQVLLGEAGELSGPGKTLLLPLWPRGVAQTSISQAAPPPRLQGPPETLTFRGGGKEHRCSSILLPWKRGSVATVTDWHRPLWAARGGTLRPHTPLFLHAAQRSPLQAPPFPKQKAVFSFFFPEWHHPIRGHLSPAHPLSIWHRLLGAPGLVIWP